MSKITVYLNRWIDDSVISVKPIRFNSITPILCSPLIIFLTRLTHQPNIDALKYVLNDLDPLAYIVVGT